MRKKSVPVVAKESTPISLLEYTKQAMVHYGEYVIEQRALADIRDGLKPVHRRILWAMHKLGLHSKSNTKKSARIVGECFVAGTLVSTPTGSIPIEELHVGDLVCTRFGNFPVTHLYTLLPQPLLTINFANQSLTCTPYQQFLVCRDGVESWAYAKDLQLNDNLVEA